ncbi:MAG: M3 family metallopeptidase [Bacteroidaceae bacterium]|nr:M3 family metallopeptidase [Bacteroidaceae bacterium]
MSNIFIENYNTPHNTLPFDRIALDDYEPAMIEGINIENEEIERIVNNPELPSFENTISAMETTGELLERVTTTFFNILSAESNPDMEALAQKISPVLSEHNNDISLNPRLFQRVKAVYDEYHDDPKKLCQLSPEEQMLLKNTYDGFVRNGANLDDEQKEDYRKTTTELSQLTLQFSQNKLAEINAFSLHITDEKDLDGLQPSAIEAARLCAKEKGTDGWVFTLNAPSFSPFMTYSSRRELRQRMYMAYHTICCHDNKENNMEICRRIVNLRLHLANLLGYETYADYKLVNRMAENKENVDRMLTQLINAYMPAARKEVAEVENLAKEMEGDDFQLMPWDFGYYANKLLERDYNINSELMRPYLELSQVKKGVFGLATRLYGISFKPNHDIPVYHPDVDAYEVFDADGKFLAVLYCDFHPREGKRAGAWMTNYKEQWKEVAHSDLKDLNDPKDANDTKALIDSRPHVSVVMNLTKPTDTKPALLTLGEVETFLHEFGHALHGMFANTRHKSLSGTNVYWDFVELPSQFMENYALEPEFLNTFAFHYQTGEPVPEDIIARLQRSRNFNVAYACIRQVSFGLLDMSYYEIKEPLSDDIIQHEREATQQVRLLPEVEGTCMTVQFSHIMAGGYAAGYYSYKWAEILDADAFSLFKQNGIFDRKTAQSFRDNILSKGGTEHPMTLYKRFRGQEPTIKALLERNGIKN